MRFLTRPFEAGDDFNCHELYHTCGPVSKGAIEPISDCVKWVDYPGSGWYLNCPRCGACWRELTVSNLTADQLAERFTRVWRIADSDPQKLVEVEEAGKRFMKLVDV